jgi:hypothetical protein
MLHVLIHTLLDSAKMLPFLFLSYLIIEFIEHKSSKKIERTLKNSGKYGPVIGGLLGSFPQCGFSITAATLYASRVITLGTLVAVFLTTSDEAIPVLLSHPENMPMMFKIIGFKLIIGICFGFIIDLLFRKKHTPKEELEQATEHIHNMCSHCDCNNKGILKPALKHTLNVFIFILIFSFILNITIHFIGEEMLSKLLMTGSVFQPIISGLIGLIPNCASSVLLTELFLSGNISFASIIAGLSSGSGIGLVILFKENKNLKENLKILALVYAIGVSIGLLIEVIGMAL